MDKNKVIESATKLISKGQFEKAVKEYQRILDVDPDDVRVLQKLAELYQKMKRQAEAADCFEKVARTYSAQGFYLKAVALYKQVLKVIDRIEVNIRLAELYQQLGLVGDATKEWQTVAAHYEKIGDQKASLDTLKKLVDLDPDNVAARIRLGEQYARQEQLVDAVAELRRAAQYLQRNGRTDDYIRVAERISHLDQGDVTLAKELAEQYLSRGDSKRALAKLQICFKSNPRDLGTLQMLARAFQELGQVSKTVSVLKELARVHLDNGKLEDGRKVYQQALELAPDDQELKTSIKGLENESALAPKAPAQPPPAARRAASTAGDKPAPQPGPSATIVPPAPPPAPAARPPTAPIPVAARPSTAPIPAVKPPTAPVAVATRPPTGPIATGGVAAVPKLLKETEVYVKYGLHEKALEHLRKIFAADPDNTEAHEKAKAVALATGRTQDAIASLATLVRLYHQHNDERVTAARDELKAMDPGNEALALGAKAAAPALDEELVDETVVDSGPVEVDEITEEEVQEVEEVEEIVAEEVDEAIVEEEHEATMMDARPVEAAPAPVEDAADDEFASDIAEVDFYIQAGLVEDARAILEAITMGNPDHPGARKRLAEIGEAPKSKPPPAARSFGDDDDERTTLDARPVTTQTRASASRDHEDLAAELAAELAGDIAGGTVEEDKPLDADVLDPFQVPAHEVLGEFRAKVQQAVRPEDVQTHYDLGIAYKEMGLLEEGIAEFELALRHGTGMRAVDCRTMLGTCEMERGKPDIAVKHFLAALQIPGITADARKALAYELATSYEVLGKNAEALEQYGAVNREDPKFRDVSARIARLGGTVAPPRPAAKPAAKPSAPPVAASKPPVQAAAAAQARPAAAAARSPAAPTSQAPAVTPPAEAEKPGDLPPDAARKNRKIGFV